MNFQLSILKDLKKFYLRSSIITSDSTALYWKESADLRISKAAVQSWEVTFDGVIRCQMSWDLVTETAFSF